MQNEEFGNCVQRHVMSMKAICEFDKKLCKCVDCVVGPPLFSSWGLSSSHMKLESNGFSLDFLLLAKAAIVHRKMYKKRPSSLRRFSQI